MDTGIAALQNAINRFAVIGGFTRVSVDGFWGPKTRDGVYNALSWIGQGKCYHAACTSNEDAQNAGQLYAQWDESMNAARGLAEFLGGVADDLGIPLVAAPIPGTSTPGPIVPIPGMQISLFERFKRLPFWQQIAMGVLAGLSLIFVANRLDAKQPQRRRKAA